MKAFITLIGSLLILLSVAPAYAGPLHDTIVAAKATAQATIAAAKIADAGNTHALVHDAYQAIKTAENTVAIEFKSCYPTKSC